MPASGDVLLDTSVVIPCLKGDLGLWSDPAKMIVP
jgi:hypothetical protein